MSPEDQLRELELSTRSSLRVFDYASDKSSPFQSPSSTPPYNYNNDALDLLSGPRPSESSSRKPINSERPYYQTTANEAEYHSTKELFMGCYGLLKAIVCPTGRAQNRFVWMLVVLTWMAILALAVVLSKLLQEEKNGDLFGMKVMGDADDDYTFTRDDVVKASNEPPDDSAGDYDYFYYNTSNETDYYFEDKVDDDNNDYYDVNDEPVDNDVYTVNDNISGDNYDDDDSVFQLLLTEADIVEMLLIDGIISKNDEYFGNVNGVERRAINYLANVHYYLKIVLDDETLRRQLVEKFALAVLYYSTGGPRYNKDYEYDKDGPGRPWSKQNNWLEDPHVCNAVQKGLATVIDGNVFEAILDPEFEDLIWEGVECDKEGFVVKVDLKQNILRGTLPTAFSGKALPRLSE